jgi:hypothetical protein
VTWWNGQAGIIDLANPAAKAWYEGNLKTLMDTYDIDGLKFDTRFFDEKCAPREGHQATDYQKLGTELADEFDLQGAGIRVHWNRTAHEAGFVTPPGRQGHRLGLPAASATQNLAISTIGYPFVESDMIGGSGGQPAPTKDVLVRWAQSASLMPLMYASTSPVGHQRHHHRPEGGLRPGDGRPLPGGDQDATRSSPPTSGTRCRTP